MMVVIEQNNNMREDQKFEQRKVFDSFSLSRYPLRMICQPNATTLESIKRRRELNEVAGSIPSFDEIDFIGSLDFGDIL